MTHFKARLSPFLKGYTAVLIAAVAGAAGYSLSRGHVLTTVSLLLLLGGLLLLGFFPSKDTTSAKGG